MSAFPGQGESAARERRSAWPRHARVGGRDGIRESLGAVTKPSAHDAHASHNAQRHARACLTGTRDWQAVKVAEEYGTCGALGAAGAAGQGQVASERDFWARLR